MGSVMKRNTSDPDGLGSPASPFGRRMGSIRRRKGDAVEQHLDSGCARVNIGKDVEGDAGIGLPYHTEVSLSIPSPPIPSTGSLTWTARPTRHPRPPRSSTNMALKPQSEWSIRG